jgi:hypothetical protein
MKEELQLPEEDIDRIRDEIASIVDQVKLRALSMIQKAY